MANEPKPTSPEWYWVEFVAEADLLLAGDPSGQETFRRLLSFAADMQLLNVDDFCSADIPVYVEPGEAEFISGAYVDAYKNAILAAVYYELCQEA